MFEPVKGSVKLEPTVVAAALLPLMSMRIKRALELLFEVTPVRTRPNRPVPEVAAATGAKR